LRHRSTAPLALAISLRFCGKNWHRYFQSFSIKFLSMPGSIHQLQRKSITYSSAYAPKGGEGKVSVKFGCGRKDALRYKNGSKPQQAQL
jgi:hypothetical protein